MPAVMHLILVVSLFAVTVCTGTITSSTVKHMTDITTSSAKPSTLAVTINYNVSFSTVTTTNDTQKPSTTIQHNTTAVNPEDVSLSPPPLTSPQTANRTEETHASPPPGAKTTNQTSNGTVSHGTTLPPRSASPNITATTSVNKTSPGAGLLPEWDQGDLANNPGLVAILCIFCIVVALTLVVVMLKCIRSPRSNFERLEDVPMGKVNEGSPFARYSK